MTQLDEVSPIPECSEPEDASSPKAAKATKKPKSKSRAKPKGFPELSALMSNWNPSDPSASRSLLVSEIRSMLEDDRRTCVKACIPALIVDGSYPIDVMHYRAEQDIYEFMTRMLWMHQEYDSAIGVLLGVDSEATAAMVEEAYDILLNADKDCLVLLR